MNNQYVSMGHLTCVSIQSWLASKERVERDNNINKRGGDYHVKSK